ncbi:putative late blight resistance protein R1B-8 [Capsicum galapagoense]
MAYAAITCLMRTIHQSMELTGFDLQPYYKTLNSLRAILEKPCKATDDLEETTSLEAEITDIAYTTEDMVDSESRNVLLAQNVEERSRSMWELFFLLEQALECMKQHITAWDTMEDLKPQTYALSGVPEQAVERPENIMVGHETEFEMMLDVLARGESELEVVSVVGMGGIGKTTLARKLYNYPCIMSRFDICGEVTVSQEFCARNVLLFLLSSISGKTDESHEHQEDWKLADQLQKLLKGKRYFVVIDDIWTTGAWDNMRRCFPDCNNGSRILLTTRNVEVAEYASSGKPPYPMRLMNFEESWSLLYEKVFANDSFPPEFEWFGKQIALKCGGLPLAIVLIAGLLSNTDKTLNMWRSVAENVSSVVSTEVQCMKVLALSYHHLPSHLKPCFLYFAIFPEDKLISVDRLVELWVVEGFLKVEEMKSIEEVAEKYLKDLIDRSLISIGHSRFDGKIESCGIHDVVRELCLMKAQTMNIVNYLGVKGFLNPRAQSMQYSSKSRGRISIQGEEKLAVYHNSDAHSIIMFGRFHQFKLEFSFKQVRVLDLSSVHRPFFPSGILHLLHLRYLALCLRPPVKYYFPSSLIDMIPPSISSLCYLQTFMLYRSSLESRLVTEQYPLILPSEILTMPQLRHLRLDWNYLWDYKPTEKSLVLKNLQRLYGLNPLHCTASLFRLLPNLKKLNVLGVREDFRSLKDRYDICYLYHLEELEFNLTILDTSELVRSVEIDPSGSMSFQNRRPFSFVRVVPLLVLPSPDAFPNLKILSYSGHFFFSWNDLSIVGKFPKLESLKLSNITFRDNEWEVAEEGFPQLKFLQLINIEIWYWIASCDHFPCLERLFLDNCRGLDSIPQNFADITTLALIDITRCTESVGNSAKQIQRDIQENYGGSVEVHIRHPL